METLRIHLVYGLTPSRERFIEHIKKNGWGSLFHKEEGIHLPIFVDQLVPNVTEQHPDERKRKLDIMEMIAEKFLPSIILEGVSKREIFHALQVDLTNKLIDIFNSNNTTPDFYVPCNTGYREFENKKIKEMEEKSCKIKKNLYFSRKCKLGFLLNNINSPDTFSFRICSENPNQIRRINFIINYSFSKTIFVLNGLSYAKIVKKNDATRDVITFRELRSVYRRTVENVILRKLTFIQILDSKESTELEVMPPPWSEKMRIYLTLEEAQILGLLTGKLQQYDHDIVVTGKYLWENFYTRTSAMSDE